MAWVFGVVFIIVGVLGFVPSFSSGGLTLGVLSIDAMFAAVYIVSGILALLAAWSSAQHAMLYFKVFGIVFAIATVAGFIEGDTVLGLMTVNTADNVLDLVIAAIALWAGFGGKLES